MRFDSAESKKEFLNTGLKKIEQGKASTITGLEKLDIYSCTESGKHLLDSYSNILDPVIFPSDCFSFHLSTDSVITIIFCVERITIKLLLYAMPIRLFHMLK